MGESLLKAPAPRKGPLHGVPARYSGSPPSPRFDQVRNLAGLMHPRFEKWALGQDPFFPGLVVHGGLGIGKTGAVIEVLKEVNQKHGRRARYEKLWRILARMKAVNVRDQGELAEVEVVDEYLLPDLLVVDEVGVNPGTLSDHRIIYEVLDARYEALLPTILTTNHDIDTEEGAAAFVACFGSRTADRFIGDYRIRATGSNLRG